MSCGHGWHGCGPWYGGPYDRAWYAPPESYEESEWPVRRRTRRNRRAEGEAGAEYLEARLAELVDEVRRLQTELASLRDSDQAAAEKP